MNKSKLQQPLTNPYDFLKQGCERPWEVAVAPFKVAPRTWYVGNSWVGAYLLETSDGLILIDSTMQPQVYLVFESIRMLGFDPGNIKLLLLSHAHYDHAGGIRAILEASGARLYMAKEDSDMLKERPELLLSENYPCGDFEADAFFSDDRPVVLGDRTVHTVHTPGHTPGTTSFFFDAEDEEGRVYKCGLHGGVGVNTLTDDFLKEFNLPETSRQEYLESMRKVRDFNVEITLGSHPGQINMLEKVDSITPGHNPFQNPAVWPDLIDKRIKMIKEIIEA